MSSLAHASWHNMNINVQVGSLQFNIRCIQSRDTSIDTMNNPCSGPHMYALHYIRSGRGTLLLAGRTCPIGAKSLYMSGPGLVYEEMTTAGEKLTGYSLFFEVVDPGANLFMSKQMLDEYTSTADRLLTASFWHGKDEKGMLALFKQLEENFPSYTPSNEAMVTQIVQQIMISLIDNYAGSLPTPAHASEKTLDEQRMQIIEESLLYQYSSLTIGELAERLALSVRQTERTVKLLYGVSFAEKKMQLRMRMAAYLLSHTKLPIHYIAERTGFASLEHFSTTYKKHYYQTPTSYRASRDYTSPS